MLLLTSSANPGSARTSTGDSTGVSTGAKHKSTRVSTGAKHKSTRVGTGARHKSMRASTGARHKSTGARRFQQAGHFLGLDMIHFGSHRTQRAHIQTLCSQKGARQSTPCIHVSSWPEFTARMATQSRSHLFLLLSAHIHLPVSRRQRIDRLRSLPPTALCTSGWPLLQPWLLHCPLRLSSLQRYAHGQGSPGCCSA